MHEKYYIITAVIILKIVQLQQQKIPYPISVHRQIHKLNRSVRGEQKLLFIVEVKTKSRIVIFINANKCTN